MASLFDTLGLAIETQRAPEEEERTFTAKEFADAVVNSREFRVFIFNGFREGKLHPSIVNKLIEYAWGKVPDKIEVEDKRDILNKYTPEQLQQRIDALSDLVSRQRMNEAAVQDSTSVTEDDPTAPSSIH